MKKVIWILNHYATSMYDNEAGRHYWMAKYLKNEGYTPIIFCSNTYHNSQKQIKTGLKNYVVKEKNEIPFVFVKTRQYMGNGLKRVMNMYDFYHNIFSVTKDYLKTNAKPDVILASSVHPLTLIAGEKIAKRLGVPCICEVRDLWPESLVEYGVIKRESLLAKTLYKGEKWIYSKADSLIFTIPGAKEYIIDQGWEDAIDLNRVFYINNGVDISEFDYNKSNYTLSDYDIIDKEYRNIVYTGSIRDVNNLGFILDCGKEMLKHEELSDIRFLIYGDGNERTDLEYRCESEGINNVLFKGSVDKKYIPYILSNSWINLLHNRATEISRYGTSQNKLFEYLASGKAILQTMPAKYNICSEYNCGLVLEQQSTNNFLREIYKINKNAAYLNGLEYNARKASQDFDFKKHTDKLINIIQKL